MASFNKILSFVEALAEGIHDLGTDQIKVALSNTLPTNTDTVFAPGTLHPPPAAANGYTAGGAAATTLSSAQTAGTYKLVLDEVVFTAASGQIGPFRYVIVYNDTAALDELIGWYDYGTSITLEDTDTFTVAFHATNGVLTIA